MAEEQYPQAIVCRSGWKKDINPNDVLQSCADAVLGHWLEGERKKYFNDTLGDGMESLRMSALPLDRMANLSTSLLGAHFKLSHFHYKQINKGACSWDGVKDVDEELISSDNYEWMEFVSVIGWKIAVIHQYKFVYPRNFAKKGEYDLFVASQSATENEDVKETIWEEWDKLQVEGNVRKVSLVGESRINHDPTILNYWHFVIDLYPRDNDDTPLPSGVSKGWRGKLASKLQDLLMRTYIDMKDGYIPPTITSPSVWEK